MTKLRGRMIEDMQLHGFAETTQLSYLKVVKALAKYYRQPPDQLTEEQIRQFFLYLVNEKQVPRNTFRIHLCGIKFFYESTLQRQWPVFDIVRPKPSKQLPIVLSEQEVRDVLSVVKKPVARMCLTTIYSCGLRLAEGIHLRVADIDSARRLVKVLGKGNKERYVPLAQKTLDRLRAYWREHRPRAWLFPGKDSNKPILRNTLHHTFKAALRQAGISKNASIHTLRHSYATHLLENGVDLRLIQEILGHKSPKTTAIYAHLTKKSIDAFQVTLNRIMADL